MAENNKQNGEVQKREGSFIDATLQRISAMKSAGELNLPDNYSAPNALQSAWLILQDVKDMNKRPALEVCTPQSIAFALLQTVLQGLNPAKRQCSFIVYGNKLTLQREYQGDIAIAKRVGLKSVVANAIFKGEDFAFEVDTITGLKKITKHVSSFESYGGEVIGAYAIIEMSDGARNVEVMNMNQIRKAWEQGPTKGQSPAHKNFPDQMACKTVIRRALKTIINSSDDAALFDEEEQAETPFTASVKHEIATSANGALNGSKAIGFEDAPAGEENGKGEEPGPETIEPVEETQAEEPAPAQEAAEEPAPVQKTKKVPF